MAFMIELWNGILGHWPVADSLADPSPQPAQLAWPYRGLLRGLCLMLRGLCLTSWRSRPALESSKPRLGQTLCVGETRCPTNLAWGKP